MSTRELRGNALTLRVPSELPSLNRDACRILLEILVELTEVPVLEAPRERGRRDC